MASHERSGTGSHRPTGTPEADFRERQAATTRRDERSRASPNLANRQSDRLLLTQTNCGQAANLSPVPAPHGAYNAPGCQAFTQIELHSDRSTHTRWIRFGKPVISMRNTRGYPVECYAPGQIFGLAQSLSATQGNALSTFEIHLACGSSEQQCMSSKCQPGSVILLSVKGWRQVRHAIALIEAIEALGIDPCCLASDFWKEIHARLVAAGRPGTKVPPP